MKISNRIKRNISFVLLVVGVACTAARIWNVVMTPDSGWAWFELCAIVLPTFLCFDSYRTYRRRIKNGVLL